LAIKKSLRFGVIEGEPPGNVLGDDGLHMAEPCCLRSARMRSALGYRWRSAVSAPGK
jgi:hypothetical protein